jgi:uncharacterized protein YycO
MNGAIIVENEKNGILGKYHDGGYISNNGDIYSSIKDGVNYIKRELSTNEESKNKVILKVVEKILLMMWNMIMM